MKIIKISIYKKTTPDAFTVNFEDADTVVLHSEVIVKYGLHADKEISNTELKLYVDESQVLFATSKVMKYLSSKIKSTKQVWQYLFLKGYSPETIEIVMNKLKEYKIVDDEIYAKAYIRQTENVKSKNEIKNKLLQENISKEIIENETNIIDDKNTIDKITNKFLKNKEINQKNIEKLINHLRYKGFEWEAISAKLKEIKNFEN